MASVDPINLALGNTMYVAHLTELLINKNIITQAEAKQAMANAIATVGPDQRIAVGVAMRTVLPGLF